MGSEYKTNQNELRILGIRVDNFSKVEINDWIRNILGNPPEQKFIVTLNPEIILKGHRDKNFADVLNSADFNLCDGFGIKFAAWLKGKKVKTRYTGVGLVDYALKFAKEKNFDVLIVVSKNSLSSPEEIKRVIKDKYGVEARAKYWDSDNFFENNEVKSAQIVFVNFGAPRQENFISENRNKFLNAKILVGVGGTFDFLTGKMKRAPRWMQNAGLEWLWRLIQEPKRIKRIWSAVFVFPYLALFSNSK